MSPKQQAMIVAISTSDSPDMAALGLGYGHLKEAMAELAIQLLAVDADLAYGGDLREHGFSQLLLQLVLRYTSTSDLRSRTRVTNHLAWPVHIGTSVDQLDELAAELQGVAELKLLKRDGTPMTMEIRRNLPTHDPSQDEWFSGLTAMRKFQSSSTDARVLLGGQVTNYKGRMPGVAEEALLSLRAGQPLFLIGGFGGCTRDMAETLGLVEPWSESRNCWPGREEFKQWGGGDLNNGLSEEENEILAATPFIGQAVVLVLRGVQRLRK
ncbi:MAG: hypothetical protein OXI05_08225 [Bacteroidota bacterium]|nr:hypothetical protein [Bacteroidota bacterium]MXW15125.1 hypothetical protein [Rhodothermaceae bacterium]MYC04763.1 hypothetical protein [Rhodothermaceae bacterium]MYI17248.1 hypothetical protein [Rhodothermaceae bacterium]